VLKVDIAEGNLACSGCLREIELGKRGIRGRTVAASLGE
jgi:hypothetical protein